MALDENELRLPDTKTGARVIPLSPQTVELLAGLPRIKGNSWSYTARGWGRTCARSIIPDNAFGRARVLRMSGSTTCVIRTPAAPWLWARGFP